MKQVEIERLLQWTFCDQKSRRSVPGYGYQNSWAMLERHLRLGCSIDSSPRRDCLGDVSAFPDSDALIVAREVGKLSSNAVVDWRESKKLLLGNLVGLASREQFLVFDEIALVIEQACTGISPIWNVGLPKVRPSILGNGKPAVTGTRYGKNRYSTGAHCPLEWAQPTIEGVALARARYAVWHSALTRLAGCLSGKLKNIVAVPPISRASPWNTAVQPRR
ncbi:hypothetical protein [Bradyrhizobium sp. AUGA SZCCT0160]|uniref:hypothetical protein n=1 Tax=Bradyrhizobium sp. AUGA SZCCT0160 TaxID=2807662 RepID=UPI001BA4F996|nr:hypothetical protein [Bradyrhizobium sp. AUGA SZCCT0160]MBR1187430.1 hypothetical protein [Bradyrhizobium sp. AUGA SZCCT0160]